MIFDLKKTYSKWVVFLSIFTAMVFISNCKGNFEDNGSFAPANLPKAQISAISVNGTTELYCSISGGCPMVITGKNFYRTAKVYIGAYLCQNIIIDSETQISCTVGPGQTGVYDIRIVNADGGVSELAPTITDPTTLQFSYASFLYIASWETPARVYGYAQHPSSGALLTIPGSPYSIGTAANQAYGIVIHPNNKFVYVANVGSNTVSTFSINPASGRLTAVGAATPTGSTGSNGLFFHPSGNFLYVSNQSGNSITGFTVAADGTLTAMAAPFPTTGASGINGVVVSSDGRFLYAASGGGNGGVVGFSIDQTTGALTIIAGSPFRNTLGGDVTNPGDGISIHPNTQWLYMGLYTIGKIAGWSIDQTTGALTPIEAPVVNNSPTPFVDNGGSASTVSPDGLFLYGTAYSLNALDPKKIVTYAIDQTTGGLTRVSDVDTGGGPNDVRVDTNGNFAYTCNTRNPPSISAYSINKTTGVLSPLTPRDYAIPAPNTGPGIMVIQRNFNVESEEE